MRIVLLGGGGHASDVLGALEALRESLDAVTGEHFSIAGILADVDVDPKRFAHRGVQQIGGIDDFAHVDASHFVSCVGYPEGRRAVAERVAAAGLEAFTVVHPRAWIPPMVPIGLGSVVLAGACVSPGAVIGSHVYLGQGSILGHDCLVSDYVSVMPGATVSGDTTLSEGCLVGANATVLEKRKVGAWAMVGAGAVVTNDVPPRSVAKGVPARF